MTPRSTISLKHFGHDSPDAEASKWFNMRHRDRAALLVGLLLCLAPIEYSANGIQFEAVKRVMNAVEEVTVNNSNRHKNNASMLSNLLYLETSAGGMKRSGISKYSFDPIGRINPLFGKSSLGISPSPIT